MGHAIQKRIDMGFSIVKMDLGIELLYDEPGCLNAPLGMLEDMQKYSMKAIVHQSGSIDMDMMLGKNYEIFTIPHYATGIHITEKGLDYLEDYVRQVRDVVGYEVPLAIDHFGHVSMEDCIKFARRLEKYNIAWLEDIQPWHLTDHYVRIAESCALPLTTGEDIYLAEGFRPLAKAADEAYALAAEEYPVLGGGCGNAKPMYGSFFMSRLQLTGVFFPFTVESNVNSLAPSYNVPFTVCHELAHLRGFMREDEANFIAYYVCTRSPDVRLQYSGTMLALVHAGNALVKADRTAAAALRNSYSEQVLRDLSANNAYWAQFDDKPLSEIGEKTNDAYLKAFKEESGVQSYGEVVDLLIAWYLQK
jgi:hypothetical protein